MEMLADLRHGPERYYHKDEWWGDFFATVFTEVFLPFRRGDLHLGTFTSLLLTAMRIMRHVVGPTPTPRRQRLSSPSTHLAHRGFCTLWRTISPLKLSFKVRSTDAAHYLAPGQHEVHVFDPQRDSTSTSHPDLYQAVRAYGSDDRSAPIAYDDPSPASLAALIRIASQFTGL